MNKSRIEWTDYSINPIKGKCPVRCSYCYARRLYDRFKWNPEIRMEPDWQEELPKTPAKVFIGSTMELFGDWVEDWMWDSIWQYVINYPQHTFIFLTKRPEYLPREFPENCWVGTSVTHQERFADKLLDIRKVKANVKFISFEPLLQGVNGSPLSNLKFAGISWVILGQQTPIKQSTMPHIEWIVEIVEAAGEAGIPVFLKNNLECLIHHKWQDNVYAKLLRTSSGRLRQELPK